MFSLTADETHERFTCAVPLALLEEEDAVFSLRVKTLAAGELTVADFSVTAPGAPSAGPAQDTDPLHAAAGELRTLMTWEEYLAHLAALPKENAGVVLLIKDDLEARGLFPELFDGLSALGIETTLTEEVRSAWYALIQNGDVTEAEIGEHTLEVDTELTPADGGKLPLKMEARDWYTSDHPCYVRLRNQRYTFEHRGIHVLLFDLRSGEVLDNVCFDLYDAEGFLCLRHFNH